MKKQVRPEVFDILKGLVDKRVPGLQATVNSAAGAQQRIGQLRTQISASQKYIQTNRYDREDTKETQAEISHYEQEIKDLSKKVSDADNAKSELTAAASFYQTYKSVKHKQELDNLKKEHEELVQRAWDLEELEFGCEMTIDPSCRSADLCDDVRRDLALYRKEYNDVMCRISEIESKVHKLTR